MVDHIDPQMRSMLEDPVPQTLQFRPEQLDHIRERARRRTRRRVMGTVAGLAAVAVVAAALGSTVFSSPDRDRVASEGSQKDDPSDSQPAPWSQTEVPDDHEGVPFTVPGTAYLVEEDSVSEATWLAASANVSDSPKTSCVFVKGEELFTTMQAACFDAWDGRERADWLQFRSDRTTTASVVVGAVDTSARTVTITFEDGRQTIVDAVATPTSSELRFFAFSTPEPVGMRSVDPIGADGKPAAPPSAMPGPECGPNAGCPTPPSEASES